MTSKCKLCNSEAGESDSTEGHQPDLYSCSGEDCILAESWYSLDEWEKLNSDDIDLTVSYMAGVSDGKAKYKENIRSEKHAELIVRAFWRRIHVYRNDYLKELDDPIPVELLAAMLTSLLLLDSKSPIEGA